MVTHMRQVQQPGSMQHRAIDVVCRIWQQRCRVQQQGLQAACWLPVTGQRLFCMTQQQQGRAAASLCRMKRLRQRLWCRAAALRQQELMLRKVARVMPMQTMLTWLAL